ncbi:MAG: adenine-specific methyltransferase EcoRI family protein [bacterium]
MARNDKMVEAKKAQKNEFYTSYEDIEKEINAYVEFNKDVFKGKTILMPCDDPEWSNFTKYFAANFKRFGLKKLISTSYAFDSNLEKKIYQLSLFESESPKFDKKKTKTNGKIFILDKDINNSGRIDIEDLEWNYLEGDGDFRSDEVKKLRDEADFIITNPPFSLFIDFINWIMEADKKFIIIGNMNSVTDLSIFPYIMNNEMWMGEAVNVTMTFAMDESYSTVIKERDIKGRKLGKVPAISWYTNVELRSRHEDLILMTMADNIKHNKKFIKKCNEKYGVVEYRMFDNYDALEVPVITAIPSDYSGVVGVPTSFLGSYNPDQFKIIGTVSASKNPGSLNLGKSYKKYIGYKQDGTLYGRTGSTFGKCPVIRMDDGKHPYYELDGIRVQATFPRIFIKLREDE